MIKSLSTAVLLVTYKRLDTTKVVFEAIKKAKPPRLYISSNWAKDNNELEIEKIENIREYLLKSVDWDCEVKTLFRTEHLSAKNSISSAISWFFENEEQGIILEDDCVPSESFFWFCQELLHKYKDDKRIWHIGGCNFQDGIKRGDGDYYFSKYNHVWGWASWADRWSQCDLELDNFEDVSFLKSTFEDKKAQEYWKKIFYRMKNNEIDTWDYQWTFSMWLNDGLAIIPNVNMVSNIGFGKDATNTLVENRYSNMQVNNLSALEHVGSVVINKEADNYSYKHHYAIESLYARALKKIKRLLSAV